MAPKSCHPKLDCIRPTGGFIAISDTFTITESLNIAINKKIHNDVGNERTNDVIRHVEGVESMSKGFTHTKTLFTFGSGPNIQEAQVTNAFCITMQNFRLVFWALLSMA